MPATLTTQLPLWPTDQSLLHCAVRNHPVLYCGRPYRGHTFSAVICNIYICNSIVYCWNLICNLNIQQCERILHCYLSLSCDLFDSLLYQDDSRSASTAINRMPDACTIIFPWTLKPSSNFHSPLMQLMSEMPLPQDPPLPPLFSPAPALGADP